MVSVFETIIQKGQLTSHLSFVYKAVKNAALSGIEFFCDISTKKVTGAG
jgi:hypothetical protein